MVSATISSRMKKASKIPMAVNKCKNKVKSELSASIADILHFGKSLDCSCERY